MKDYKIIDEKYLISTHLNDIGVTNIMSLKPIDIKGDEDYFINELPKVLEHIGLDYSSVNVTRQVHSNSIAHVNGNGDVNFYDETDGLIGDHGDVLVIKSADCLPVIVYDSVNALIAAVHSGWKGTANSIVKEAISKMLSLGSSASELKIYVGPHIQKTSFEVMDDVKNVFEKNFSYEDIIFKKDEKHYLIDLGKVVKLDAISMGAKKENIYLSKVDTVTDERFHSYRRDKKDYGLMYTLVCI
ncbi:peptidoglycan editing factor PgeF [Fenollaria timonensis]|uniref:peptidoglycan editing factor PgeF n=1 Tax=Fenollaria timonensis TaxID=1723384 RepID=UPI00071E5E3E|nr:peptidoglycan editing factor PgeF [Fenollaria timonensis]